MILPESAYQEPRPIRKKGAIPDSWLDIIRFNFPKAFYCQVFPYFEVWRLAFRHALNLASGDAYHIDLFF